MEEIQHLCYYFYSSSKITIGLIKSAGLSFINNNASSNPETSGVQVYYSDSTPAFEKISNKTWANYYYEAIASLGAEKRGLIDNSRYIVIGKSNMPSIIVENAFMSNSGDMTKLMDDNYLKKLAMKICDSTIQTLNNSK